MAHSESYSGVSYPGDSAWEVSNESENIMTKNDGLKTLTRLRMEHTAENYTQALAVTKVYWMKNVDMMIKKSTGTSMNGSLDGAVLASYAPLLELLSHDWTLMNIGPGFNQFVLDAGLDPEEGIDQVVIYAAPMSPLQEGATSTEDVDYLDEVFSAPSDLKLEDCPRFYVLESPNAYGVFKHAFPKGDLPAGSSWIDGMERTDVAPEVGAKVMNDGPDFVKNVAALMNWIAENVQQGDSAQ